MKPTLTRFSLLLFFGALLFLASCNLEGVAGFSQSGGRAAVVRNSGSLYVTNGNGSGGTKLLDGNYLGFFDASFSPDGNRVAYVQNSPRNVCTIAVGGGAATCRTVPSGVVAGIVSYLPNGSIALVYQDSGQFVLRLYNSSLTLQSEKTGFDQFFLSPNAYEIKRGTNGREWYMTPYNQSQPLRWVITEGQSMLMYTATNSGVSGPTPLPSIFSASVQAVLADRSLSDITSGAVSPNGQSLVFRTGSGSSLYNLYVMDLTVASGQFTLLAENANFPIQYAYSPDGSEIAYESPENGRSIWVADADGSNRRRLASGGASLPEWH